MTPSSVGFGKGWWPVPVRLVPDWERYGLTGRRVEGSSEIWLDAADWRILWMAHDHGYDWRRGRVPVRKSELKILKALGARIWRFLPELPTGCGIVGEVSRQDYAAYLAVTELTK